MTTLPDPLRFEATLARIDSLLHSGRYEELERLTAGVRLTADEIRRAIEEYPESLCLRPTYLLADAGVVCANGARPQRWAVYLHLWKRGGGRSDLTVELTLIDSDQTAYRFEIDDIHVL